MIHFDATDIGWDAVSAALGNADRDIPSDVIRAIRQKAQDLVDRARAAVLAEPTHGTKHTGLRARIAAATVANDTADGSDITSGLDGNDRNLPRDMDYGSWEHPLNYRRQHQWVTEDGFYPWFTDVMDAGEPEIEWAVEDALNVNIAKIEAS